MKHLIISIKAILLFTVITGIVYPLLVTLAGQVIYPFKSNGSILILDGKKIGSALIGQQFDSLKYFSSRPSFVFYNALPSGASNYGPTSTKLAELMKKNKAEFVLKNEPGNNAVLPSEMLFNSASGLDPDISPEAAMIQVNRIVKARCFSEEQKMKLIQAINNLKKSPQFYILGCERINVLKLNLETDKIDEHN
jgi:potassium-transporting ATPase KdpC subunit